MSKIEDKAVEAIDLLSQKMGELAVEYGPKVTEAAMMAARIDAAQTIVVGVLLLGVALLSFLFLSRPLWRWGSENDGDAQVLAGFIGAGSVMAGLIGILFFLTNLWAWAGLFHPELWIAKKVLGL